MEYIGKLYGKIGNKYFELGKTSEDFDLLEKDKSTYFAKQLDVAMAKIKELEFEAMERRADLQDLENENKDLTNKNESQAMRIGMYKSVDDEIEKYTEDIESLQKELIYARSVAEDLQSKLDLNKLYLDAEVSIKNIETVFKEKARKDLELMTGDRDCAVHAYNDTKIALDKSELIRGEFLDEIDILRLGVCHIKDMIEENNFEAGKCSKIIERILAPTKPTQDK